MALAVDSVVVLGDLAGSSFPVLILFLFGVCSGGKRGLKSEKYEVEYDIG